MYRAEAIKDNFIHLLGWRQNYNTSEFSISGDLTKSETGQYYQDMHPLITLDNIRSIAPVFNYERFSFWNGAMEYKKGEIVKLKDALFNSDYNNDYQKAGETKEYIFRALADNNSVNPVSNPDVWEPVDLFSEWLRDKTCASILKAVESYYSTQLSDRTVRNLLESKVLFDGAGRCPRNSAGTFNARRLPI